MAKKWAEQNPAENIEGHLAHLGFNGDQEAPCYMTEEVVKDLAEAIQMTSRTMRQQMVFSGGNSSKRKVLKSTRNKISSFLNFANKLSTRKRSLSIGVVGNG
jgi:hypothetical protein